MKTIRTIFFLLISCLFVLRSSAQSGLLNSYPPAKAVAYLDFNGAVVRGSIWNMYGATIEAKPASLDPVSIKLIHTAVAGYFNLFNLNVSTDPEVYAQAPVNQRIRIIITPDGSWYGNTSGASITGSFTSGDDTPGWVFTDALDNNPRFIAASIAHQIGHALGLQHQALYNADQQLITETSGGENHPLDDQAPIMGVPFYKTAQWINGPTPRHANNIQNDTAQIAGAPNNLGYRKIAALPLVATANAVRVGPNNAEGISVQSSGTFQYRLFDISGKLLQQGALQPGSNSIASNRATGMLLLQWYDGSSGGTEKIIR